MGIFLIFNRLFRGHDCVIIWKSISTKFFLRGDIQMNTCLSSIYLKFSQIDSRYFRIALIVLALFAAGGKILGLPIPGDVGI
jgi:hypothetical protein